MSNLLLLRGAPGAGKTEVGTEFAKQFGWIFIELDAIKRSRGDVRKFDPEAFHLAGRRAAEALAAESNVIVEEYFYSEWLLQLFLGPTGLTTASPNVIAVWLACDRAEAVRRKKEQGLMTEADAEANNDLVKSRYVVPKEQVIDTSLQPVAAVVERLATGLRERGVELTRPA